MIATLAEVKQLLSITVTTSDALITAMIPMVQSTIIDYTKNNFEIVPSDGSKIHKLTGLIINEAEGSNFLFNATDKKITAPSSLNLETYGFAIGDDISIKGSSRNDGVYSVAAVSANIITVNEELITETTVNYVVVRHVKFPKALKIVVAQIIKSWMNESQHQGVASKSLGDYSESYFNELPKQTLTALNSYRRVTFV